MHAVVLRSAEGRTVKVFLTQQLTAQEQSELEVAAAFANMDVEYLPVEEIPHALEEMKVEIKTASRGW